MESTNFEKVTIDTIINAPVEKVWEFWTGPQHIMKWNAASEDWHTTRSENDLRPGGKFVSRMEARDGSFGFDFEGVYDEVIAHQLIVYTMEDGRQAKTTFTEQREQTVVATTFDAESKNPVEMQKTGWQAILDSFKRYVEAK